MSGKKKKSKTKKKKKSPEELIEAVQEEPKAKLLYQHPNNLKGSTTLLQCMPSTSLEVEQVIHEFMKHPPPYSQIVKVSKAASFGIKQLENNSGSASTFLTAAKKKADKPKQGSDLAWQWSKKKGHFQSRIIAISGQARVGKDTLASRLVQKHGFVQVALADPIKQLCHRVFNFSEDQLWGESLELKNAHDPRYTKDSVEWMKALGRLRNAAVSWLMQVGLRDEGNEDSLRLLYVWFFDLHEKHPNLSPRLAAQTLGTEYGRNVSESVWIDVFRLTVHRILVHNFSYHHSHGTEGAGVEIPGVVVSDVRFKNELETFSSWKAPLIRVYRPIKDEEVGVKGHSSEQEQKEIPDSKFDYLLFNDGTLEEYHKKCDALIEEILKT